MASRRPSTTTDRELRDELERVQAENRQLHARVAELEALEQLQARVDELEEESAQLEDANAQLKARLDRADQIRESWDRRSVRLRRELTTAREEQERLRRLLENARDEALVKRR